MADHEELHLVRVNNGAVDYSAGLNVVELISWMRLPLWKESSMMTLHHNNAAHLWLNAQLETKRIALTLSTTLNQ